MKGISLTDTVPPLQGLEGMYMNFRIGRCPMLKVLCAYSATGSERGYNTSAPGCALKGQVYFKAGHRPVCKPVYNFLSPEGA